MHVFIDDSGDGGFKFASGSTTHLIMSAVVFHEAKQLETLKELTNECKARHNMDREVKFSRTKARFKADYFTCIKDVNFVIRAIAIDKRLVHSAHLRSNPSALKSFAIRQLLTHTDGVVSNAKVVIDGQDTKAFGITDHAYLRRMANKDQTVIGELKFADSKQNVGLQLADMTAGAIHAARRARKPADSAYLGQLRADGRFARGRGGSLWDFK